jgi:N-acetylneuraminic acid mutarotase
MAAARLYHTVTLLANGKVLAVGGGNSSSGVLSSAELYDPATGQWTPTGSLNIAREAASAVLLPDGKVLVAGGQAGYYNDLTSAELYDPATGTWSMTGDLHVARYLHEMQVLANGKVVAFGGYQRGTTATTASTELYDPATGEWTETAAMNRSRAGFFSTVLEDGKILTAGGCAYGYCPGYIEPTAEIFDPAMNTWTLTASPNEPRSGTTMVTLNDGRAFVPAGVSFAGGWWHATDTVEGYDPSTGVWTAGAPMASATETPAVALLDNGQVLVAGGNDGSWLLSSTQVYDPVNDTWLNAGRMQVARRLAGTLKLPDGRVLAAGGTGADWSQTSSAEIFTPGAQPGPPQAAFWFSPGDPSVFDTVQFYDQSSDPDLGMSIVSWSWKFGDGTTSSDTSPSHRYAQDGSYNVTLTVTTSDGRSGSTSQTVEVRTHDVSILWASVTSKGRVGRTSPLQVGIGNVRYPEMVQVDFYKSVPNGSEYLGSITKSVPVMSKKQTTLFSLNYTFTDADRAAGKVNFQMVATIQGAREAFTGDNTVVTRPTVVTG